MSFFEELKRRNVVRVGIAYAVAAWVILQLTDVIGEIMELPEWGGKLILLLLIAGLIPALIFAWAFELTPDGVKREADVDRSQSVSHKTGRKLDFAIIALLALGLAYFIYEARFKDGEPVEQAISAGQEAGANAGQAPAVSVEAEAADGQSIAVLPFTNRSPNADDIYFTDGVHDDLLTQLAKLDSFSVISRTSVMEYRDTEKKIGEIAGELGVANIMEGAVQRAGNQVRINVQLIDAATDEHLWAEVYDRELTTENLFKIQSEIASNIAEALHATLSDEQIATMAEVPTDIVEAYEFYQQARRFTLGETDIGFDTAIALYEAALELDPSFKLAWIGLARAHMTNYWQYGGHIQDRQNARDAIEKARALDPDFPELHLAEGFFWYWGHLDYNQAIEHLQKAIDQMPGNADAHMWMGWASRRDGQWERAVTSMAESLRLDPRVVVNWSEYSNTLTMVGRHDEAVAAAEESYVLDPDNYWAKNALGDALFAANGDIDRASTLAIGAEYTGDVAFLNQFINTQTIARKFDEVLDAISVLSDEMEIARNQIYFRELKAAIVLKLAGRDKEAIASANIALQRIEALRSSIPYDYRYSEAFARMHAVLGNSEEVERFVSEFLDTLPVDAVDESLMHYSAAASLAMGGLDGDAVEMLDRTLSQPGYFGIHHLRLDPRWDGIRDSAEFQALMKKHAR